MDNCTTQNLLYHYVSTVVLSSRDRQEKLWLPDFKTSFVEILT